MIRLLLWSVWVNVVAFAAQAPVWALQDALR